ncbi:hypothetical protein [Scleromatobacter humisilvae]|uniref:Uncharacterized protein n=1 Tax=Scleromatobacter humisilvae TaxID=2897159 RepID=A0A9X2C182_9BURK|nr:hypothetical protein [Scleromatobacter humisilvae]MCK9687286.1 hypothetical protein [Scleromatobacter humisilvae]
MKISLKTLVAGFVAGVAVAGAGGAAVYVEQAPARKQAYNEAAVFYYLVGAKMADQAPMGRVTDVHYVYDASQSAGAKPVILSSVVTARVCAPLSILPVGCDAEAGETVTKTASSSAELKLGELAELEGFVTKSGLPVNRKNLAWPRGAKT